MMTTTKPNHHETMPLNADLRTFLKRVRAGQCLSLAAWAAPIVRTGRIDGTHLARCFALGFEPQA